MKRTFLLAMIAVVCGFYTIPADGDFMVVSYNVENLFDTIDNPATADEEFTPEGDRHWTAHRYYTKLSNIWKALAATTTVDFPDVIGFYEVENRKVVEDLLRKTPLWKGHYSIFHRESLDRRGIDVAVVYREATFRPLDSAAVGIHFTGSDSSYHTRDILYLKGFIKRTGDTLHIFANHWPSRYGGQSATDPLRCQAASVLRSKVDSIIARDSTARILCMGDFNDNPSNMSVGECLGAENSFTNIKPTRLYNISYYLSETLGLWTYRFQGRGDFLDQVIVTGTLLDDSGLHLSLDDVRPLVEPFLLNDDGTIHRSYLGPKYQGGYSDHLPVVIRMWEGKK